MVERHRKSQTRRWIWWAVCLVLVAAGILLIILSLSGPKTGPNIPGPIGKTSAPVPGTMKNHPSAISKPDADGLPPMSLLSYSTSSSASAVPRRPLTSHLPAVKSSKPVHLTIPAIGVDTRLMQLGLNTNGTVEVPTSWYIAGWYKYGPTPGQLGSSVILGHVDSVYGPAVFYKLADLRPGNLVNVKLADGTTVHFKVIGLREYEKTDFPDKLVYGKRSYDALQLVTCGGIFDSATGHYLSNIVVFTERVA